MIKLSEENKAKYLNLKIFALCVAELFYLVYFTFSTTDLLPYNLKILLPQLVKVIFIWIISVDVIFEPFNIKTLLIVAISFIAFTISRYASYQPQLILLFLSTLSFKDIELNKFVLIDLVMRVLITIASIISIQTGMTVDATYASARRMAFTFGHPNQFGAMIMLIGMELLYILKGKKQIIAYIINMGLMVFMTFTCISRTSILCLGLYSLLFVAYRFNKKVFSNKASQFLIRNFYLICLLVSYVGYFAYKGQSDFIIKLNKLLSARLQLTNSLLDRYPLTPFGCSISMDNGFLDNGYLYVLLSFGIVCTLILAFLHNRAFDKLMKKNNYPLVIIGLVMLFRGLSESSFLSFNINTFVIMLSYGFFYYDEPKDDINPWISIIITYVMLAFIYITGI